MKIKLKTPVTAENGAVCEHAVVRGMLTQTETSTFGIHVVPEDKDGNLYPQNGWNLTSMDVDNDSTPLADCGRVVTATIQAYLERINVA